MMKLIKKYWLTAVGVAVGAIGGGLYWLYIGCSTGTCPITSSPIYSALWGGIIGGILFDMFNRKAK